MAIEITMTSPNAELPAAGFALLVVRYDGLVPGADDGVEPDFVYCEFWEYCVFEPWLPPAGAVVGFEVSIAGPIGAVHLMTGEPGHMEHVFSVVVKPEGQPVGRV